MRSKGKSGVSAADITNKNGVFLRCHYYLQIAQRADNTRTMAIEAILSSPPSMCLSRSYLVGDRAGRAGLGEFIFEYTLAPAQFVDGFLA